MSKVKYQHIFVTFLLAMAVLGRANAQSIFGDDEDDPDAPPATQPVAQPRAAEPKNFETKVLYEERTNTETGYKFVYELSDGQGREEIGTIHNAGTDQEYLEVTGFYRYTGPDNYIYRVNYKSGPGGYEAETSRYLARNRISPVALKSLVG
ncbi:larval cuticle protein 65Ag1-like [Lutzomyia longipalpis]|uniref:larval cuticle protein 65Ag1-like n=1 Tax=Lutzomyia longipalpis TaxID=7200 RepID=UPI002483CDA7|nr:larval cuticle protein 65Ag1-like [Lutzomyia longipalpis]